MKANDKENAGIRWPYFLSLVAVVLAAVWPFSSILGYYFTRTETGWALYYARVASLQDFIKILLQSRTPEPGMFYRPVMSLSFSLNYALGGLDPFSYHLVDLLLHASIAGLLFHLVYRWNGRDVLAASVAGLAYSLHPILVDVVPAVVYRHETLMALFLLVGLWCFYRYEYQGENTTTLVLALAFFVLSVGSKEVGMIFLPIVVAHLAVFNPSGASGWKRRSVHLLKRSSPYVVVAGLYIAWWLYVTRAGAFLGGLQGETYTSHPLSNLSDRALGTILHQQLIEFPSRFIPFYFRALFHPFLDLYMSVTSWFTPSAEFSLAAIPFPIQLTSLVLGLIVGYGSLQQIQTLLKSKGKRTSSRWPVITRVLSGLLLTALLLFPIYAPLLDRVVDQAYSGRGLEWLAVFMESKHRFPLIHYLHRARAFVLLGLGTLLIPAAAAAAVLNRRAVRSYARRTAGTVIAVLRELGSLLQHRRSLLFYAVWMLIPAIFYSITHTAGYNNTYVGILPLSALLGTVFGDSVRALWQRLRVGFGRGGFDSARGGIVRPLMALALVGACFLHLAFLVRTSPLMNDYPAWEDGQELSRRYHAKLFQRLKDVPPGTHLRLHGVPWRDVHRRKFPHSHVGLDPVPWIKMWFPDRNFTVNEWLLRPVSRLCPCPLRLETHQLSPRKVIFLTRFPEPKFDYHKH